MINFFQILSKGSASTPSYWANKPMLVTMHGQSNMGGSGGRISEIELNYPDYFGTKENMYVYNNSTVAFDQLNVGVNHNSDYGNLLVGPEVSLVNELRLYTTQPIHYLKYAVGATSIFTKWSTSLTGELWDEYISRIDNAVRLMNDIYGSGNWVYLANLWHQGEADSFDLSGLYENEEFNIIMYLRNRYGNGVIFISGGIRQYQNVGESDISFNVNYAKQNNAAKSSINYWFDNDDLTLYDTVHYNTDSQVNHGIRYVNLLKDKI